MARRPHERTSNVPDGQLHYGSIRGASQSFSATRLCWSWHSMPP